ncbi:hypothetical protein BU23DRAFT_600377 [Bimuria novae-zelandiae CBS 107.79]|uniref:Uncharacterized protein n=1 Tax=Bimuria novae-zelandiae CBS 107.79 TaxID=1447943 RepID=A0A6A5V8A4_9PLEO|nr:hypothetical protein BU23DRAFT_600377 [Bimuria novae-zelandiae CBS 107.79]
MSPPNGYDYEVWGTLYTPAKPHDTQSPHARDLQKPLWNLCQWESSIRGIARHIDGRFAHEHHTCFANGWNRLPDELRICILSFNLCSEEPIPVDWPNNSRAHLKALHHLRMTPQIAALAQQTYYSLNTFHLQLHYTRPDPSVRPTLRFLFPRKSVNHDIRRLHIEIVSLTVDSLRRLEKLAEGFYGFPKPQQVRLYVHAPHGLTFEQVDMFQPVDIRDDGSLGRKYIRFSRAGRLDVVSFVDGEPRGEELSPPLREFERQLRERITFAGAEVGAQYAEGREAVLYPRAGLLTFNLSV